jgi:hypothetical protein
MQETYVSQGDSASEYVDRHTELYTFQYERSGGKKSNRSQSEPQTQSPRCVLSREYSGEFDTV